MDKPRLTRDQVEAAALKIGAPKASVFKWRRRGVPGSWALKIVAGSDGAISADAILPFTDPQSAQVAA